MKILHVSPKFHHDVASGSTKVAYDISYGLAKRGHFITVYTSDVRNRYDKLEDKVEKNGNLSVYRFQTLFTKVTQGMKFFITPQIIPKLSKEIQQFSVIHLHEYHSFQNIAIYYYARKYGIPYVLHAHGSLPRLGKKIRKSIYDYTFGYRLLKGASKVIALNQPEVLQCLSVGIPKTKIVLIPNGINLSEYTELPPKGFFKKKYAINDKIILYLGRINRIKGLENLAMSFKQILDELAGVKLVIIGPDDGYLKKLQILINSLKVQKNVLILGPLYGNDKIAAYIDASVLVLPSIYEMFPITILEALACNLPIILSESCFISDIIRNRAGLVVHPTPEELKKSIIAILNDDKLQKEYSDNCKYIVKEFDLERTISMIENVYFKIEKGENNAPASN